MICDKDRCKAPAVGASIGFMMLPRVCSSAVFLWFLTPLLLAQEPRPGPERWEKEIAAYEQADARKAPPTGVVLFIGSSSIGGWKTLAEDFPDHPVLNRGFGGSELADSLHFFDRIVLPYRPRQIFLYAGTNDIQNGKTPEQVVADFKAFVEETERKLPGTEIAYIAIAPNPARWARVEQFKKANDQIAKFAAAHPNVVFVDVFTPMLGSDGKPRPDIFLDDQLHMNERGYRLWRWVVRSFLR
jgi:hypothetical protein